MKLKTSITIISGCLFLFIFLMLPVFLNIKEQKDDMVASFKGSEFSLKVFKEMSKIPYGKTKSYKQIAERIKEPKSARAVGRVSGSNKIPIIIPCHRIVGSNGELVGYSGGGGLLFKSYLQLLEKS